MISPQSVKSECNPSFNWNFSEVYQVEELFHPSFNLTLDDSKSGAFDSSLVDTFSKDFSVSTLSQIHLHFAWPHQISIHNIRHVFMSSLADASKHLNKQFRFSPHVHLTGDVLVIFRTILSLCTFTMATTQHLKV